MGATTIVFSTRRYFGLMSGALIEGAIKQLATEKSPSSTLSKSQHVSLAVLCISCAKRQGGWSRWRWRSSTPEMMVLDSRRDMSDVSNAGVYVIFVCSWTRVSYCLLSRSQDGTFPLGLCVAFSVRSCFVLSLRKFPGSFLIGISSDRWLKIPSSETASQGWLV
jgi:hypothetical protein